MIDKENKIQEPVFGIEIDKTGLSHTERSRQRLIPIKRFIKYCFLYDPLVNLNSGEEITGIMNPDTLPKSNFENRQELHQEIEKQTTFLKSLIIIPSLKKLREQYLEARSCKGENHLQKAQKKFIFYSCLAPCQNLHPQSLKRKIETNKILYYKQYICCEHEGQKGWMILVRSEKFDICEFETQFIGIGENIVEADLDFQRKKNNFFIENMEFNHNILDLDIPLDIWQMERACEQYDKDKKFDTFKYKHIRYVGSKKIGFELFFKSEKYKFKLTVYPSSIKWTVQSCIEAGFKTPLEATGKTLKEAFDNLMKKL